MAQSGSGYEDASVGRERDTLQIDRTYAHLLPDAAEHERGLLDAFDARTDEREEHTR